jgi:hypothetical protein
LEVAKEFGFAVELGCQGLSFGVWLSHWFMLKEVSSGTSILDLEELVY